MRSGESLTISLLILISSCSIQPIKQNSLSRDENDVVGSIISKFENACLLKEKNSPRLMDVNEFLNSYKVLLIEGAPIVKKRLNEEITESQIDEMIDRYNNYDWIKGTWNISTKELMVKSNKKCNKEKVVSISNILFNKNDNKALCYAIVSTCAESSYSMWILSREEAGGWVVKRSIQMGGSDSFSNNDC